MSWFLVVVAIVVLLIVTLIYFLARGLAGRGPRLTQLPVEARRRYAEQWRVIETRFIDHPREAAQEADRLAVAILGDRGARMHEERAVPRGLRAARELGRKERTDDLRQAMQRYQAIVDEACGRELREAAERGRLEIA